MSRLAAGSKVTTAAASDAGAEPPQRSRAPGGSVAPMAPVRQAMPSLGWTGAALIGTGVVKIATEDCRGRARLRVAAFGFILIADAVALWIGLSWLDRMLHSWEWRSVIIVVAGILPAILLSIFASTLTGMPPTALGIGAGILNAVVFARGSLTAWRVGRSRSRNRGGT